MSKKIGWDDESIKSIGKDTRYKLEAGRVDVIRIIDKAKKFSNHWLDEKQKHSSCSMEEFGKCPACEAGYKKSDKIACTIIHIATVKGKTVNTVGQVKVWIFSPTVYGQIREINSEFGDIRTFDLKITCSDSKFQRIGSMLPTKKTLLTRDMIEEAKENKDLIDKFTSSKSPKDIKKALEGEGEEQEELSLDDEPKKKKGKVKDFDDEEDDDEEEEDESPKKKKSSKEDDEELDEDDDEDEDDEPKKKKKKKKSKDDDEDDDEFNDLLDDES